MTIRRSDVRHVLLSEIESDLSRFLREAGGEEIVITRNGKPAGVLIGFASEDDWLDYQLENHPCFLSRIEPARKSLRQGRVVRIEKYAAGVGNLTLGEIVAGLVAALGK
jgi:prevent-host-death family protein